MARRMAIAMILAGVCLFTHSGDGDNTRKTKELTESEMAVLYGGHGGAACDQCAEVSERMDECAHFTSTDPCKTNQCIENWLIEGSCQVSEQSNCWAEMDFSLDYLIQYLRADSNCSTNNPSNWDVWRINYYGSTCKSRTYLKRCQKPTNNCNGALVDTSTRANAINCI